MGLKSLAEYVQSQRDDRVTFWDGERIDDTPPIALQDSTANTATDYAYDEPECGGVFAAYGAKCGRRALDEFEFQCSVKN